MFKAIAKEFLTHEELLKIQSIIKVCVLEGKNPDEQYQLATQAIEDFGIHEKIMSAAFSEFRDGKSFNNKKHLFPIGELNEDFKSGKSLDIIQNKHSNTLNQIKNNLISTIYIHFQVFDEIDNPKINEHLFTQIQHAFLTEQRCKCCGVSLLSSILSGKYKECSFTNNDEIKTTTIEIPSGELLVSDYFYNNDKVIINLHDIEESKSFKTAKTKNPDISIYDTSQEIEYLTVMAMAEKNLATVFVGDISTDIFSKGNEIISVTETTETEVDNLTSDGYTYHGKTPSSLWRASFIDKNELLEILMTSQSKENAIKSLEIIESKSIVVHVQPGIYKLTFGVNNQNPGIGKIKEHNLNCSLKIQKKIRE